MTSFRTIFTQKSLQIVGDKYRANILENNTLATKMLRVTNVKNFATKNERRVGIKNELHMSFAARAHIEMICAYAYDPHLRVRVPF